MVLSFQFADTVFTAVEQYKTVTPDVNHLEVTQTVSDGWFVTCSDAHSGESATAKNVTAEQVHAIVSLAMGSGEEKWLDDEMIQELYHTASMVMSEWPVNVMPIP